jgi:hypothetical protein
MRYLTWLGVGILFLSACASNGHGAASLDLRATPLPTIDSASRLSISGNRTVRVSVCESGDRMPTADRAGSVAPMPTSRQHTALPIPNPCDTSSVAAFRGDSIMARPGF